MAKSVKSQNIHLWHGIVRWTSTHVPREVGGEETDFPNVITKTNDAHVAVFDMLAQTKEKHPHGRNFHVTYLKHQGKFSIAS